MDAMFIEMGTALTQLAVKGTASTVSKKMKAAKEIKEIGQLHTTYDEIINELINEREEAVSIAQAYKSELDRIVISDEDIEHLHNTVARIIEIIKALQLVEAKMKGEDEVRKVEAQVAGYEQIKALISVDSLKTMQLLGFNYKEAIGEPLTEICATKIRAWGGIKTNSKQNKGKK